MIRADSIWGFLVHPLLAVQDRVLFEVLSLVLVLVHGNTIGLFMSGFLAVEHLVSVEHHVFPGVCGLQPAADLAFL